MDRKGIIIVSVVVALMLIWEFEFAPKFRQQQQQQQQQAAAAAGMGVSPAPSAGGTSAVPGASPGPSASVAAASSPAATPAPPTAPQEPKVPEQITDVNGPGAHYHFTNLGGGISRAELFQYPVESGSAVPLEHFGWLPIKLLAYPAKSGSAVQLNQFGSLPIGALSEEPGQVADLPYTVTRQGNQVLCVRNERDGLTISKKFTLPASTDQNAGYGMTLEVGFTNSGTHPIQSTGYYLCLGSAAPIHPRDYTMYTAFDWSLQGGSATVTPVSWFEAGHIPLLGIETHPEHQAYVASPDKIAWTSVSNQFFAVIAAPRGGPLDYSSAKRPDLGLSVKPADNGQGAVIAQVYPGSDAEKAGLQSGDTILALNGKPITDIHELLQGIANMNIGDQVTLSGSGARDGNPSLFSTPVTLVQAPAVWADRFHVTIGGKDLLAIQGAVRLPGFTLQPGQSTGEAFQVYAGPKIYNVLKNLGAGQEGILNLGWFTPISIFLLNSMSWLHRWTGSYAISIIFLTLCIRGILWPVQNKATASMRQMQALQPLQNELKEKYKDDPQRLNQEVIKLFKEYKVNPMAGCLPMFIQIPIFFGFYRLLATAIELRNSTFLWVHDLSQPDTVFLLGGFPVNILPICMAVTMLVQTSMTPKSGDQSQQRMIMFMPLIFVLFCYNFASALALYYTVQNIFSIAQLYATRKRTAPALPKPPAKRKSR